MSNLWPDFSNLNILTMPKTILEDQANYLVKATDGKLYGAVEEVNHYNDEGIKIETNSFEFNFVIKGKFLPNYKFKAFTIYHDIVIYPLSIMLEPDIGNEIFDSSEVNDFVEDIDYQGDDEGVLLEGIKSEEDFKKVLYYIFRTEKIKNVVESLISLS